MLLLPLFVILSATSILLARGQGYCTRAAGIYNVSDGGIACMQASTYNVADCCFTCAATGPGYNARCGSLYNYGTAQSCSDIPAITQAQIDCGGAGFTCQCNGGSDLSQLMGTPSPSAAPTTTPNPTSAPTSGAGGGLREHTNMLVILWSIVVLLLVSLVP